MKLFSKLFGKKSGPDASIPKDSSYLLFLLDENSEPFIKVVIADTSKKTAVAFSDLIHNICNGNYTDSILKVLLEMRHQDKDIYDCVKNIVLELLKLKNDHSVKFDPENTPQVKPTQFYHNKNV